MLGVSTACVSGRGNPLTVGACPGGCWACNSEEWPERTARALSLVPVLRCALQNKSDGQEQMGKAVFPSKFMTLKLLISYFNTSQNTF